jgi:hypothetical protein
MLCSCADFFALAKSRRDNAVTRQFSAQRNPGIIRLTACRPNPAIPNLIMDIHERFSNATLPLPVGPVICRRRWQSES